MATFSERGYNTAWLKNTFLLGVDLTLDDGSAYPDVIFETSLKQAERAVSDELGLVFNPQQFQERHDKEPDMVGGWYPLRTRYRPIIDVEKVQIIYGRSKQASELPPNWANITEPMAGQIHLVPVAEGASSYVMSGGMPVILGLGGLSSEYYIPAYFQLLYNAGFPLYKGSVTLPANQTSITVDLLREFTDQYEASASSTVDIKISKKFNSLDLSIDTPQNQDIVISWIVDTLPSDIVRAVALKASLLTLDVAGDLIAGAGLASVSTSMDGLSQNINTTASATNSGYGARVIQFTKEYKELIATLRATYRSLNIFAL
jgi:hypothetical protein